MSTEFESLDSVLCEFNDVETPPDLTVRPASAALLVRIFRERLFSEQALRRRDDRIELEKGAREGREDCLRSRNVRGAAYCLGNLALLLKIKGDKEGAVKSADEAARLASESGVTGLAAEMEAARDRVREESNGA